MFRKACVLTLVVATSLAPAWARRHKYHQYLPPLTSQQRALLTEAMAREKITLKAIEKDTPVVQTYIQNFRPDQLLYQVPVSDEYAISRVNFGKNFSADIYGSKQISHGFFKGTLKYLSVVTQSFSVQNSPTGFMDMMFVDPSGFDFKHYQFAFVREQFLGEIRTSVFDVRPRKHTGAGRFFGRIWVENNGGNIVRFNGTYTSKKSAPQSHYYHFDSWRTNVQPGLWLPYAIYVEETHINKSDKSPALRARTTFWGYSLKTPQQIQEQESVDIENADDQSQTATDLSPLQAERQWISEAENNVLDRLQEAGVLAAPSPFDQVLNQVVENIVIGNKLELPGPVTCRVLLTEPFETLAVGDTILISKGLIDALPNEEDLAAVLSFQLAQIALGHRMNTAYAFSDRLLFPDEAAFQDIVMAHSLYDDTTAAKRAEQLFMNSVYAPKAGQVGVFYEQLMARSKALKQLLTPRLGDPLLKADGQPWMASFLQGAPKLNMKDMNQIAALPLNSHLKINPWNDQVETLNVSPTPLLSPADKMPFEITPVYFRLRPYQPPTPPAAAASTSGSAQAGNAADQSTGNSTGSAAGNGNGANVSPQGSSQIQEQNLPAQPAGQQPKQ